MRDYVAKRAFYRREIVGICLCCNMDDKILPIAWIPPIKHRILRCPQRKINPQSKRQDK
jgi:hypothetical protein